MRKLYDEIMGLEVPNEHIFYVAGFEDAKETAAELAKKYDDEIEKLNEFIKRLNEHINELSGLY